MKKNQFATTNFYLAVFLACKGLRLLDIDRTDPRRAIFIFEDTHERGEWVSLFNFGEEALVDARKFASTIKGIKPQSKLWTLLY